MKQKIRQALPDLIVNKTYRVKWNGSEHNATVIAVKFNERLRKRLYYLHYEGYDKRLDEWRDDQAFISRTAVQVDHFLQSASVELAENMKVAEQKTVTRTMARQAQTGMGKCQSLESLNSSFSENEREREEIAKLKNIDVVEFGEYEIQTWYYSPFPEEYRDFQKLYFCEFCLKYMRYSETLQRHALECKLRHPPGTVVYDCSPMRIYQVDGKLEKLYCQNLSLLSKLFLDHKTVFYDIEPFNFYVLCEIERTRSGDIDHVVGYFSKEKHSFDGFNLACIMILPPFQRKGYGRLLIEFSYELSKIEQKIGQPERPLSDLGLVGYLSYWQSMLLLFLRANTNQTFSVRDLSEHTCIAPDDIILALTRMNLLRYWKDEKHVFVTEKQVKDAISECKVNLKRTIQRSSIKYKASIES